jgi:hypothetical protein
MLRLDAHHEFRPPGQGPEWFRQILFRNRFEGSIYAPSSGTLEEALGLAEQYPYIRRVVPRVGSALEAEEVPDHPLITSVRLTTVDSAALAKLKQKQLSIEIDPQYWPCPYDGPIALLGMTAAAPLTENVFIKLLGFALPAQLDIVGTLGRLMQDPGPERLMFASGWPFTSGSWKSTMAAFTQSLGAQRMELRERILGGTAAEFYRIR